jgi:spore coat-associated protein N
MVPGDTLQRSFDLTSDSSQVTLTTTASPSTKLDTDATNGLQMVIQRCSVAWTESGPPYTYTCGGSTSTVLAGRQVIGTDLALAGLTGGGTTDHLRLTLTLPAGADNTFQNLSSTITYAFTASG